MVEQKQDFDQVLDQLKSDARRTVELRKSAELEALKAMQVRQE